MCNFCTYHRVSEEYRKGQALNNEGECAHTATTTTDVHMPPPTKKNPIKNPNRKQYKTPLNNKTSQTQ